MDNELSSLVVIFTEFYYWVTVVMMFLIHVGFCMYEVGVSRRKNHLHTLMKNTMLIPLITVTFFYFGWWIYFALPNGPFINDSGFQVQGGGLVPSPSAVPWSELMGVHMGGAAHQEALTVDDTGFWARINGVFWAAFLLFSWTTASIVSGAVIERIRSGAFWILAVVLGSCLWITDAAWGWHWDGWMVHKLGYHDAYASGVVHAIAGGFALAVLSVLGPRIGKFTDDGTPRDIRPNNPWLVTIGLFLIYTGFWGFYAACNIPIIDFYGSDMLDVEGSFFTATNIYLSPTSLSGITLNFLMSLSGGLMAGYLISRGDPFWTYSSGLGGVVAASAGNDLYHPIQSMLIAMSAVVVLYNMHYWVERKFKIDDAVGAVAVHGYAGFYGVCIAGFMLWGYPATALLEESTINPLGQFIGAIIMFFVLGFFPGLILAKVLNGMGILRIPEEVELAGLDINYVIEDEKAGLNVHEATRKEAEKAGLL